MTESDAYNLKELASTMRGHSPPYPCPACSKSYRSMTGIMYHLGQFGPPTKVPRCLSGDYLSSPKGSPAPSPASPGMPLKRKTPRREMTWAEAQRLVEIDFETCYRRVEIERDMELAVLSEEEEEEGGATLRSGRGGGRGKGGGKGKSCGLRTPQKGGKQGKGFTPRGKSTKNKGKRKSKQKGSSNDNPDGGLIPLPKAECNVIEGLEYPDAPERKGPYFRFIEQSAEEMDDTVEYDMDEEDYQWLSLINEDRKALGLTAVPQAAFEILMDRLEKECFFESKLPGNGGDSSSNIYNIDENAECCICNDGECHNTNAILFCDMCNLAVHQECYGVPYIPEGQWLCRRCLQSPSRMVDCALCPNKGGAFKQTIDGKWSHVTCALWIPEVQFANTVFLEPIDGIKEIPAARWKLTCYICRRRMGACIQCAKANCYSAFHVTCAQHANLYMKIEVVKGEEVRKVAYCDGHTPPAVKRKRARLAKERGKGGAEEPEESKGKAAKEGGEEQEEEEEGGGGEGKGKDCGVKIEVEVDAERRESVVESEGTEAESRPEGEGEGEGVDDECLEPRRLLEERKSSTQPVVNIPYVPQHRLDRIISRVSLHKKSQFIPKLVSYWKLKRQSRNGVPLLRRLQASNHGQRTAATNLTEEEREVLSEQLTQWKGLRHDLERARLLVELVRKREKLKREQLRLLQHISELRLCPLTVITKRLLDKLAKKDPADIFAEPVLAEEVPDYPDVIKHPMDFGTMRKKVDTFDYHSLDEFEQDFYYVWHNATVYNQKDTIYYRAAIRIRDAGYKILERARHQLEQAAVDEETGLHEPAVVDPPPLTPSALSVDVDQRIEAIEKEEAAREKRKRYRSRISSTASTMDEQVEFLEERLEMIAAQYSGSARKMREKNLRRELNTLRRQMKRATLPLIPAESDEQAASPRRPTQQPVTRNAEELASHVLHGSLRLTPSRQQILSHSGIRLEERASALQDEATPTDHAPTGVAHDNKATLEEPPVQKNPQLESGREDKRRPHRKRPGRGQPPVRAARPESYIAKMKKKAHRIKFKKMAESNGGKRGSHLGPRQTRKPSARKRLESAESASDREQLVNGKLPLSLPLSSHRQSKTHGESSAQLPTNPAGRHSEEQERLARSPFSDAGVYRRRLASSTLPDTSVPSASTPEDLTVQTGSLVREPLGRKRKHSSSSIDGAPSTKKTKRLVPGADSQRGRAVNGLVNGGAEVSFKPLDLVWAKCRGYPSYPALVIDPDMPSKGLRIHGERIHAPSDEVLELRDKNPGATFLVRFFDGRRTWQWLPNEKLEPLGLNLDFDQAKVSSSGPSKRSVQQAYQRARHYQRGVTQKAQSSNDSSSDSSEEEDDSDV